MDGLMLLPFALIIKGKVVQPAVLQRLILCNKPAHKCEISIFYTRGNLIAPQPHPFPTRFQHQVEKEELIRSLCMVTFGGNFKKSTWQDAILPIVSYQTCIFPFILIYLCSYSSNNNQKNGWIYYTVQKNVVPKHCEFHSFPSRAKLVIMDDSNDRTMCLPKPCQEKEPWVSAGSGLYLQWFSAWSKSVFSRFLIFLQHQLVSSDPFYIV